MSLMTSINGIYKGPVCVRLYNCTASYMLQSIFGRYGHGTHRNKPEKKHTLQEDLEKYRSLFMPYLCQETN